MKTYWYVIFLLLSCTFDEAIGLGTEGSSSSGDDSSSLGASTTTAPPPTTDPSTTSDPSDTGHDDGSETGDGSEGTGTGGTTEGSESSDGSSSGQPACEPHSFDLDPLAVGEVATLSLDFEDLPDSAGEIGELCIEFSTNNYASARTIVIDGEEIAFGPCGAAQKPVYYLCKDYLKPAGVNDIVLTNQTYGPGCQSGDMSGVTLHFQCPDL